MSEQRRWLFDNGFTYDETYDRYVLEIEGEFKMTISADKAWSVSISELEAILSRVKAKAFQLQIEAKVARLRTEAQAKHEEA